MKLTRAETIMQAGYTFSRSAFHDDADYIWTSPDGVSFRATNYNDATLLAWTYATKRYKVIERNNGGADMWVIWDTLIEKICSHGYQDLALANEIAETMNSNDPHMLKQQTTDLHAQIAALEAENATKTAMLELLVERIGYVSRMTTDAGMQVITVQWLSLIDAVLNPVQLAPAEAPATSEGEG